MKRGIFLPLLLIVQFNVLSQVVKDDRMVADYMYRHLSFYEAIDYYEKVSETSDDWEVMARLGDCYLFTHDYTSAVQRYRHAVKLDGCTDEVRFRYANLLMKLERYDEALPLLEQIQEDKPDERRLKNLIESCKRSAHFDYDVPNGLVVFQDFNTDNSEFGVAFRSGELVFTVDSAMVEKIKNKDIDKWSGSSYYHMYSVSCDRKGHCEDSLKRIGEKFNKRHHDGPASFTEDGSVMFFTRTNHGGQIKGKQAVADNENYVNLQIMIASDYDKETGEYKKVKSFPHNNMRYSVAHPAISPGGNLLVFASDMPGGEGGTDLYMSQLNERGKWSKPENLGIEINTEGEEVFPFITQDTVLYFSSNGLVGRGGLDVYESKWNARKNTFSTPKHLGIPVNSSYDDMSFAVSKDGIAFFSSDRPAPQKGDNIYYFREYNVWLDLRVTDGISKKPAQNCAVRLISNRDNRSFVTDENGIVFTRLHPQNNYNIEFVKKGYDTLITKTTTVGVLSPDTVFSTASILPEFEINYEGIVANKATNKPVKNSRLVFISHSGDIDTLFYDGIVPFSKKLERNQEYHILALKEGYYGGDHYISTKNLDTQVDTTIKGKILMNKLQVGAIVKIDDIYYDYDKATIREDAKKALDGLLSVLKENPSMKIQINSHTDCRGSYVYNKQLSQDRAQSVVDYLQEKGIDINRLSSRGYGESAPLDDCNCESCSEEIHQENRRTEFKIISM